MNSFVLVLCEGKEDKLVFEKIASVAGLSGFVFEDYGGKDNLTNRLRVLKERPDFTKNQIRKIAITRDADDSHESAWQSLCSSTKAAFGIELVTPGQIQEMPGDVPGKDPAVGITGWILPGDGKPGMLETLCLLSISDLPAYRCLSEYVKCLESELPYKLHPKAQFHAWVVSHTDFKDKDYNIATAVKEDRFAWNHDAFDSLRTFLRSLVN